MENNLEKQGERFKMVERWQQSGKSINEFCKEENIGYYSFAYWRDKFLKQNQPNGFIKIKANPENSSTLNSCEIIFANGNRISFSKLPDMLFIKQLMS